MRTRLIFAIIPVVSLSACLSAGAGSEKLIPVTFDELKEASSSEILERGEELATKYDLEDPTPVNQIELLGGLVKYAGIAAFGNEANFDPGNGDDITATSAIELSVNFGTGSITGEMANFYAIDDSNTLASIDGILQINNGSIIENEFSAGISGNLTIDGDELAATGSLNGGFFGFNADAVEGKITGTLGQMSLFGGFIAEIQQ